MNITVGIDEAGRGPLAGPVCVGCVVIRKPFAVKRAFPIVRDSKKLSPARRDEWFQKIKELNTNSALSYGAVLVPARVIDTRGISYAISSGITRVLKKVNAQRLYIVLLDGGLRAPKNFNYQKTIIKGDEKELVIALASVVAKVTRDRYMVRAARTYPGYGFEIHKGYGTKKHIQILKKRGLSALHRVTFCTKLTK